MGRKFFDPNRPLVLRLYHKLLLKYRKFRKKTIRLAKRIQWRVAYRVLKMDPGPENHLWVYEPDQDVEWTCLFRCKKCGISRRTTRKPKRDAKRVNVPGAITWPRYDKRVEIGTKKYNCEQALLALVHEM